ncbi:helix-turn-helix domain-containing protein [Xanthobacter sp. VNH20]|uniref:helix-turn-helix domain-containing protein n=1 Tax=Xanthobacter sp. VNH20 TaxID=3156616 RepID=UPI0032B3DB54
MKEAPKRERIRAFEASAILGVEVRTVQALACRGELPGACKIGGLWTFDEAALRAWIKERSTPGNQSGSRSKPGGSARSVRRQSRNQSDLAKAYEEMLQRLRRSG